MKRTHSIVTLVAATAFVAALLAVFAVEISDNQAQSRRSLQNQAHQRAVLVSRLIDVVFEQQAHVGVDAQAALSTPIVAPRELGDEAGHKRYAALLDSDADIIAHTGGFTARDRIDVEPRTTLSLIRGRQWAVSDVRPGRIINLIASVRGASGDRTLVTGVPVRAMSDFVSAELHKVPGVTAQHQLIVDGQGVVVGSTVPDRPAGYVFHTAGQLRALHGHSGIVASPQNGTRYFDSVPLGNTNWRLIISVPVGEFFASVGGLHHWLPWIIFAAFGIVALIALALIRRAMQSAYRIRVTNERLTTANADLGSAHLALEESNAALERSNIELERQAQELVRSNNELDQFASIASHDLQEPLRKVRTFTERVSETEAGNLSERGTDYLRRANASAERMQTLIEDLLRFSRVSTQGRPFSPVDLAAVAGDVLEDLSEQTRRTGARVEVGPLPTINADAAQMRQLLQNLVSNALKFQREGVEPVVRVNAEADAGWITLTVADNGIGFDPQYSQRIFRVFERLHGRGTYPGTGIGLALCRKIAERHGGTIVADSAPDQGATFTITMQTQRTEAVSDSLPQRSPTETSASREEPYVTA